MRIPSGYGGSRYQSAAAAQFIRCAGRIFHCATQTPGSPGNGLGTSTAHAGGAATGPIRHRCAMLLRCSGDRPRGLIRKQVSEPGIRPLWPAHRALGVSQASAKNSPLPTRPFANAGRCSTGVWFRRTPTTVYTALRSLIPTPRLKQPVAQVRRRRPHRRADARRGPRVIAQGLPSVVRGTWVTKLLAGLNFARRIVPLIKTKEICRCVA